ncbi:hypothetical protein E2C01_094648 [Portunus trituberculatus]|uniref:EF-hand domain-containing protein n=1 Tax=Portunus trituberculatus TaxID=210409 RepID=A0A5B7JY80_PORTR|nr:hypothetical protein [Portunus trituberculatus]
MTVVVAAPLIQNPSFLLFTFTVEQIFREANISPNGMVRYQDFCRIVCAPVPDYY